MQHTSWNKDNETLLEAYSTVHGSAEDGESYGADHAEEFIYNQFDILKSVLADLKTGDDSVSRDIAMVGENLLRLSKQLGHKSSDEEY